MSSFLPNITVAQAVRDLGLKTDLDRGALQQKIRAGLDRLYNFQHEDGGWGWWETDESHPFMTAYVVAGLAQAKAAGVQVNAEAIEKGAAWLRKGFAADSRLAGDLRAYMAYALAVAGTPDGPELESGLRPRSELSPYGLALLGLALEAGEGRARRARSPPRSKSAAKQDQEQAWWPATRDQMLDFSEDATPEATAYAVKFLSHQRPDSPLLPKAALWLMNHRNEGYWWSSTKQTAMVIYGLTDYLKASDELNPESERDGLRERAAGARRARSTRPRPCVPSATDARREPSSSRASTTSASPPRARGACTTPRAPNTTPPRTSCRRPARFR